MPILLYTIILARLYHRFCPSTPTTLPLSLALQAKRTTWHPGHLQVTLTKFYHYKTYFSKSIDFYLRTTSSGELKRTLPEEMTALYQCMTFWYKLHHVDGMSFKTIQEVGGNVIELSHSLEIISGHWVFSEMPLERRYMKSKVFKRKHF